MVVIESEIELEYNLEKKTISKTYYNLQSWETKQDLLYYLL